MKKQHAEFQIQDLLGIGMTLVVLGIALSYGLTVQGDIKDDIGAEACAARSDAFTTYSNGLCSNGTSTVHPSTADFNASENAITGVAKLPEKLPLIATVVVAAVIIGILVRYLFVQFVR